MKKRLYPISAVLLSLLFVIGSMAALYPSDSDSTNPNGTIEQQQKEQPPFVNNRIALLSVSGINSGTGHFFEGKNQQPFSLPFCPRKGLSFRSSFSLKQSHFMALRHHYKLLFPFHSFW